MLRSILFIFGLLSIPYNLFSYVNTPPSPFAFFHTHTICANSSSLSASVNHSYSKENAKRDVSHKYSPPGRWTKGDIQLRGGKFVPGSYSHWAPRLSLLVDGNGIRHGVIEFHKTGCGWRGDSNLWVDELIVGLNGILDVYNGGSWVPAGNACLPGMFLYYYPDHELLRHIRMDGRYAAIARYHSASGYYRIVASSSLWTPLPEPATYGAILGMVGLSLVLWRKKRRALNLL